MKNARIAYSIKFSSNHVALQIIVITIIILYFYTIKWLTYKPVHEIHLLTGNISYFRQAKQRFSCATPGLYNSKLLSFSLETSFSFNFTPTNGKIANISTQYNSNFRMKRKVSWRLYMRKSTSGSWIKRSIHERGTWRQARDLVY